MASIAWQRLVRFAAGNSRAVLSNSGEERAAALPELAVNLRFRHPG
jgi:hypothetical protein